MRPRPGARFELRREIGRGTLGAVWEAWDTELGATVALKALRDPDPIRFAQLASEFRIARQIVHPNVVRLYEITTDDDMCAIVMELVRGPTIADAIREATRASDTSLVLHLLRQLALGLAELHRSGFIHRDIKPANVLVDGTRRVVILDFDLCLRRESAQAGVSGTPRYLAPEALWGRSGLASDWWSVGVLITEALGHAVANAARRPSVAAIAASLPPDTPAFVADWIHSLLALDPTIRGDGHALLERMGETPVPLDRIPLVGRERELATLRSELESARTGVKGVVAIVGAAGIGKSALLERFVEVAEDAIVVPIAFSHAELFPLAAVDAVASSLAAVLRVSPVHPALEEPRRVAAIAFPSLRRPGDPVPSRSIIPAEARGEAHRALFATLLSLARERPLILAVEDAQWADADSAAVLVEWLRHVEARLLFVATWRDEGDFDGGWLARAAPSASVVRLGPLEPAACLQIARALGRDDADAAAAGARGNPLALVHDLSTLDLDEAHRRLAHVLALAHAPLSRGIACRAADVGDGALRALVELEQARVVRRVAGSTRLAPYHDVVRTRMLASADDDLTRHLHGRIADAMIGAGSTDDDAIVPHLRSAGRRSEAAARALSAADAARAALAFEREATHLRWALDGCPQDDHARILRRIAEAWHDGGYLERAAIAFDEASAWSDEAGRRELRLLAAETWIRSGHVDRGTTAMLEILANEGIHPPRSDGARMLSGLARRIGFLVSPRIDALELADASRDEARLDLLYRAGNSLSMSRVALAYELMGRFLASTLRAPSRERLVQALGTEAVFAAAIGGQWLEDRSERMLANLDRLAQDGNAVVRAGRLAYRSIAAWEVGRWRDAAELGTAFEQLVRAQLPGRAWDLRVNAVFTASALFFAGDVERLHAVVTRELDAAVDRGDPMARVHLTLGDAGLVHLLEGAPERAWEALRSTESLAPVGPDIETYYRTILAANTLLFEARYDEAHALLTEREALLVRGGVLGSQIPRAWYAFACARAVVGRDPRVERGDTRRALHTSRRILASRATPPHRAWRMHVEAWIASDAGRRAAAASAYRDAGMHLFAWAASDDAAPPSQIGAPEQVARWLDPSRVRDA